MLRQLELNSNRLDAASIGQLLGSVAVSGLEVLSLSGNDLPDEAAEAIAASPHLRHLRRLDLAGNELTDDGLTMLGRSTHLPALRIPERAAQPDDGRRGDRLPGHGPGPAAWRLETDLADRPRRQWFETH